MPKIILYTVRLNLAHVDIIDDSEFYETETPPPTLRDIATIINIAVGQGVEWNLAHEIAIGFNLDYDTVVTFISNLFNKYAKMTEEEGYKATFEDTPRPYGYDKENYMDIA